MASGVKPRQVQGYRDWTYPNWSASHLNTLLFICGAKYRFQKVDRLPSRRTSIKMKLGLGLDEAVFKPAYIGMKNGKIPDKSSFVTAFEAWWENLHETDDTLVYPTIGRGSRKGELETPGEWLEMGLRIIDEFLKEMPEEKVAQCDYYFEVPLLRPDGSLVSERPLVGVMDMVSITKAGIRIIDYKVSGQKFKGWDLDHDFQAISYQYAMEQIHPEMKGKIVFGWQYNYRTKKGGFDTPERQYKPHHYEYLFRMIEKADAMVKAEIYIPRRKFGFGCGDCGWLEDCDKSLGGSPVIAS